MKQSWLMFDLSSLFAVAKVQRTIDEASVNYRIFLFCSMRVQSSDRQTSVPLPLGYVNETELLAVQPSSC
jgi:hypothetical protein